MEIIIRKALPEDANNYADCGILCWQSAYRGIVPDEYLDNMSAEKEQKAEMYKKSFTVPENIHSYCVMRGEKMIGFITIDIENAAIWAIYLIEDFCGKGHGKKLLDFALNELSRFGHEEVFLWVLEKNIRAIRFYEKHNFYFNGTTRIVDWYGVVPLTQLQYALKLR